MLNKLYIRSGLKLSIKIIAILILYQFCRLLFFFYNLEYFSNIYLIDYLRIIKGSIRFDISAILYVNSLVILLSLIPSNLIIKRWYKDIIYYLFIYCNLLGIIVNIIDVFYYPFSKSRLTISFLNEFSNEKSIFRILVEFFKDYWFTIPLLLIVFYILKVIANKTEIESKTIYFSKKNIFSSSIICLLCLTLVVFGI